MIEILRKPGYTINPNDKIVNGILKGIKRCKGKCPCYHGDEIPDEDLKCPCKEYRDTGNCRCSLYVPETKSEDTTQLTAKIKELEAKLKTVTTPDFVY